jgi:hypothetical protein
MIKLYNIQKTKKRKTEARGFFLDNGKIYYDYLTFRKIKENYKTLEKIRIKQKQICLFYEKNNKGIIFYNPSKIETLNKKIIYIYIKKLKINSFKTFLKELLHKYNGFTIYNYRDYYKVEVFYND